MINRSSDFDVDVICVGAGVVGLSVAMKLAEAGLSCAVLEKGPRIGEGVSSRNSGVIHAGLYYPPHSLKAQYCVRGNTLLYEYCEKNRVPHRRCGKWVVTQDQKPGVNVELRSSSGSQDSDADLELLFENAHTSGATGLERVSQKTFREKFESRLTSRLGFYSANTGIIDPAAFASSLRSKIEERGSLVLTHAEVFGVERILGGFRLDTSRGPMTSERVVNAAGLHSDEVARFFGINDYEVIPWRGNYFRVQKDLGFSELIYPVKPKGAPGLGVHLTLDLVGGQRLGPDVSHVDSKTDFSDPTEVMALQKTFYEAASKYLKGLSLSDLHYDSCGIRPKLRKLTDH